MVQFQRKVMAEAALQDTTHSFPVHSVFECCGSCVPMMSHNPCMFFIYESGTQICRCGQRPVLQVEGPEVFVYGRPECSRPLGGMKPLSLSDILAVLSILSVTDVKMEIPVLVDH